MLNENSCSLLKYKELTSNNNSYPTQNLNYQEIHKHAFEEVHTAQKNLNHSINNNTLQAYEERVSNLNTKSKSAPKINRISPSKGNL